MTIADAPVEAAVDTPVATGRAPGPDECLVCFVLSRVDDDGCDNTLRWARSYRDSVAPTDRGLERRLEAAGGYCDCEILVNAYVPTSVAADGDEWPDELPECGGVRHGSTVPCWHWASVSTGRR